MRLTAKCLVGVSLFWFGCAGAAWAAEMTAEQLKDLPGLNKMVWLRVPPARKAPTIDGTLKLGEGEWGDAVCVAGMLDQRPALLMPIQSLTFVTWDADNLYVGMRTGLLPGQVLRRRLRWNEANVHSDDAIELAFDPLGRDQVEPAFYRAIYNSLGFCMDMAQTVGVEAKFWNGNWTFKSDYQRGMDHWDLELAIPISSMGIKGPNRSGQVWRFLACRDWKNLQTTDGKAIWNVYSSLTGWGGFVYADSYAGLVLDDAAPAVQLLSLDDLWHGKFGMSARLFNPSDKPIECVAVAKVFPQYEKPPGTNVDWLTRQNPIHEVSETMKLAPGQEATWTVPARDLPALGKDQQWYDMVFGVTSADGKTVFYRAQRHFKEYQLAARVVPYELPLSVTYNPVRSNLAVLCDVLDFPKKDAARAVQVRLFEQGAQPDNAKPIAEATVTTCKNDNFEGVMAVPGLKIGAYPVRAVLVDKDGQELAHKDLAVERLDEAKEFAWWKCKAGILDKTTPPHKDMQYRGNTVVTTMGEYSLDGSALPGQIRMTGKDMLAAPVRLSCSAGGKPLAFKAPAALQVDKRSAVEVDMTGRLTAEPLDIRVSNHMEYDGCMRITLTVEPKGEPTVDYLRLEIPLVPERAQWLWTMAQDCRASWLAIDLRQGKGVVWDSSTRRGFQMAVGTFMPQYVVTDSLRGLLWFADNDKGWVPTDDAPATEVVRGDNETVLRVNFIGKPFKVGKKREIVFYLLGLPGRPLPKGWRLYNRTASQFGHYVGDPVMNYSAPMPKDFKKAQQFIAEGQLFNKDGTPAGKSGKWSPGFEFAPWHDSHNWFRTPDVNPKTFSYFQLECGDGGWTPTMLDYKCYLWDQYIGQTDIAGVYFDTPENMGFNFNVSNETAYIIPDDQPHGGEVQPGYTISGFREYVKRVRGIFAAHGRTCPWMEMHSTHGPVAPCTPFLEIRTDGEHFRLPSAHNFMTAWSTAHLRTIDVPPMFGIVTRWLGGYPWDGMVEDADPVRSKIGALTVHDVFTGWGDFGQSAGIYKDQALTTRQPPFGYKHPNVSEKLIAHGMNRDEVVYHPYWDNRDLISLAGQDGKAPQNVLASLWRIPSQNKVVVVAANFNQRPVKGVSVKLNLKDLGLAPASGDEKLIVVDFETGAPLDAAPVLDIPAIDFWMLMFTKARVAGDAPAAGLKVEGAQQYDKSKGIFTTGAIGQDLAAHGFLSPEVRHYGADKLQGLLELGGGAQGIQPQVFHVPSQDKVLVALSNDGARASTASVKLALDKFKLSPAATGETLIVLNLRTGAVLQETCYDARERMRVISGAGELGKVNIEVPAQGTALVLFARQ